MAVYTDGTSCNRAAVYNYKEDVWTFQDLPNVITGTAANVNSVFSYADATQTYASIGGSYHDQESPYARHPIVISTVGGGVTQSKLYGIDLADTGSLSFSVDTTYSEPFILERQGIDLDEQGLSLSGYKVISKMLPQVSTVNSDGEFSFTFGAADIPTGTPNYGSDIIFDSNTSYKVDTRISGRYLSYKMTSATIKDFNFSGMDVDLQVTGRR